MHKVFHFYLLHVAAFQMSNAAATEWPPDVLRFLMPALCHLVAEDKARAVLKVILSTIYQLFIIND